MRFDARFTQLAWDMAMAVRSVERAGDVVEVLAPEAWPNARVETWLDWSDNLPTHDENTALLGGPAAYAGAVAAKGRILKVFAAKVEAQAFCDELTASMLLGLAAPATLSLIDRSFELAAPLGPGELGAWVRSRSDARLASEGAAALNGRLQDVASAVLRCEGGRDACSDPLSNPALARAARAALDAGASPASVRDAIALAGMETEPAGSAESVPDDRALVTIDNPSQDGMAALAAWRTGSVALALAGGDAEVYGACPVAAITVWAGEGLSVEDLHHLARLWTLALAIEAAGTAVTAKLIPAGVHERLVGDGLAYGGEEGAKAAGVIAAMITETVRETQVAASGLTSIDLGLMDDAELSLRLGSISLGASPWAGPVSAAETADGETLRVMHGAALSGLKALNFDADAARIEALGARSLETAPGLGRPALHAAGFSDHEIEVVETALRGGATLDAALAPAALGEGFIRDVLGASEEALASGAFDTLAAAGFSAQIVAEARAHIEGSGRIAHPVFAAGADIGPAPRLAMIAALETAMGARSLHAVEAARTGGPEAIAALIGAAREAGVQRLIPLSKADAEPVLCLAPLRGAKDRARASAPV